MKNFSHTTREKDTTKIRKVVIVTIFLIFLFGGASAVWFYSYTVTRLPSATDDKVVVLIPKGSSFDTIITILAEKKVIEEDVRFKILAHLFGYGSRIQAGEFAVEQGLRPIELLEMLASAKTVQHKFTVAEGLNVNQIAELLEQYGWCKKVEVLELAHSKEFAEKLGLDDINNLEGYLYPDTYYFTRVPALDAEEILSIMVSRFHQVWSELETSTFERHKTVILASIVEKETGSGEERPLIAAVFHNRLKRGMRLQSDPTVIYGIKDFSGNITKKDLKAETPYNTYVIRGLPKGPISNPGRESLHAVLNPASVKYLYFVSKNDGTHHFSTTLREHNRAVNRYQRKR